MHVWVSRRVRTVHDAGAFLEQAHEVLAVVLRARPAESLAVMVVEHLQVRTCTKEMSPVSRGPRRQCLTQPAKPTLCRLWRGWGGRAMGRDGSPAVGPCRNR